MKHKTCTKSTVLRRTQTWHYYERNKKHHESLITHIKHPHSKNRFLYRLKRYQALSHPLIQLTAKTNSGTQNCFLLTLGGIDQCHFCYYSNRKGPSFSLLSCEEKIGKRNVDTSEMKWPLVKERIGMTCLEKYFVWKNSWIL